MEYDEIFRHRGNLYDAAMQLYPQARSTELRYLFLRQPLRAGERVLDVPAGGGYLQAVVPAGVVVEGFEVSDGFRGDSAVLPMYGAWNIGVYDRAVWLAASHHIADKPRFLRQIAAHVQPGGWIHWADIDAGSPQAGFLDRFVGRHNGTGHDGLYLDAAVPAIAESAGLIVERDEILDTDWRFSSRLDGLRFVTLLFGLRGAHEPALSEQLDHLGAHSDEGGMWHLPWRLRYIDLRVPL